MGPHTSTPSCSASSKTPPALQSGKMHAHALSGSHLHFASEYRRYGQADEEPYRNWLLLPREKASGQMFPIPPGAVRGVWRKPAVTQADIGKRMTVVGESTIMVMARRDRLDGLRALHRLTSTTK